MENIQFNHDSIEMYESFSLTKEQANRLESVIVFESIVANSIINRDYKDDENSAPRVLRTKTGVLSRSLKYASTDMEKLFLTFVFATRAQNANTILSALEAFDNASTNYELKAKLVEHAEKHFGDKMSKSIIEKHLEEMMAKQARPLKPFKKLIRQVENSNYDFSLFKAMIDEEESSSYIMEIMEDTMQSIERFKDEGMFRMGSSDAENDED
jgi:hypothetical protein